MSINFSWLTNIFKWDRNQSELSNRTKRQPRRPTPIDYREYEVANSELTKGLYHNSFPGMKLAGSLAYAPIATPVAFMGIPVPVTDDEEQQKVIEETIEFFFSQFSSIHTQGNREGTIWVWPKYSAKLKKLLWEFIPDVVVTDIIEDIHTRELLKIITDEEIQITTDYNTVVNVRRIREFTKKKVTVKWSGSVPEGVDDESYRNPVGILPIPFANNKDAEEHRGHSDYERIIPDLKDYHDIDYAQSSMLAKFKVKQVQYFGSSVKEWLDNNGYDTIADIEIDKTDFIMNRVDDEKTEFIFPSNAYQAYEAALKRKFKKIVEGSGMPEILWGIATDGNHASAENDMDTFIMYVKEKRQQYNDPYLQLFNASFLLLNLAGITNFVPALKIRWNDLTAVGEKAKAEIFQLFAKGVSDLVSSAGATKEQLRKLWAELYPEITEGDQELFSTGLADMARHKQYKDADFMEAMDVEGNLQADE